ncbi:PepSY domain-containing protein [Streptomyces sp. NPDC054829]
MRKKNAIAAIVVSGIMLGGAGVAMGGEPSGTTPNGSTSAQVRSDSSSGVNRQSDAGLAVGTVAAATDAALRSAGDGRVTEVAMVQKNGTTVWKVTVEQSRRTVLVTLDATTGAVLSTTDAATLDSNCATSPGTGSGSSADDDDDDFDDDDDDDDDGDDDGPDREGANPSK